VTGWFLIVVAFLFAANWLRQIAASVASGQLPADLQQYGWPMNPYFVLDLGFLLPLMALAGFRLLTRRPGGVRFSVPLLVMAALIGISILATLLFGSSNGPPVDVTVAGMFVAVVVIALGEHITMRVRSARTSAALASSAAASPPRVHDRLPKDGLPVMTGTHRARPTSHQNSKWSALPRAQRSMSTQRYGLMVAMPQVISPSIRSPADR